MKKVEKLKIDLITQGIKIDRNTKEFLIKKVGNKFYNDDYVTTTGVMLELFDDVFVTANINENSCYELIAGKGNLKIKTKDEVYNVKFWPPSKFMVEKTENKFGPIIKFVNAHFDRARINPISGCSFNCKFCSINEIPYKKNSIKEMELALKEALKDERITHVLISGGTPKQCDLPYLTEVFEYFCKNFKDYKFDVMMTPRGFDSFVDEMQYESYLKHLKEIGVDGLSINIELFNKEFRKKYCPEKNALGLDKYLKFLTLAGKIFGATKVRSGLIVGLESKEDTLKAVEEICKCGVMPMLSPYIPYNNIGSFPKTEFLIDVLEESKKIIKKYDLELAPTCKYCKHNTL